MRVDEDLRAYVGSGNAARAADVLALMLTEQRRFNENVTNELKVLTGLVVSLLDSVRNNAPLLTDIRPRQDNAGEGAVRDRANAILKRHGRTT